MSSTSYTEFNADMFLCNNFESSGVYSKDGRILSTPTSLTNATFFNLTEIKKVLQNPRTSLKQHHIDSLEKIIDPTTAPSIPYDISAGLYYHLVYYKKTYADFLKTKNDDDWIYTFGQSVEYTSNTSLDETTNTIHLYTDSTYT